MKTYKDFIIEAATSAEKAEYKKLMDKYGDTPITKVPTKDRDKIRKLGDKVMRTRSKGPTVGDMLRSRNKNRNEEFVIVAEASELSKYHVAKNPHDKKWYAMGHVGNNKWMPVSSGFKSKAQAQKWARSQDKVDKAARGEVGGI